MDETRQYTAFLLDGRTMGVPVERVQEVMRPQPMTRVPLAPPAVRGLMNLRGQVVLAIDLRRRLNLAAHEGKSMNVVVRTEDGPVSLLVDEIWQVLEVSKEAFEKTPETVQGVARELVAGAYKLKDRLLLILDIEKTVAVGGVAQKTGMARDTQT